MGANVNVLTAKYVGHEEINLTKKVLQMWNKSELKPEGITCVTIQKLRNDKKYSVESVIVKEELTPLLGAKASQHTGLLEMHPENFVWVAGVKQLRCRADKLKTADQLIKEYQNVFEGDLGTLPGAQRLEVNPGISPNISPLRRVALALKLRLKQELEKLTKLGVIAPMDAPRMNLKTQVHRIPLPRTPCHQRGPETRPRQDKGCARNAATGQHQNSQKILWIHQSLSKVYAETK